MPGSRKSLTLLGATGSIGRQTLEVVSEYPDRFRVAGASCNSSLNELRELLSEHPKAKLACIDNGAPAAGESGVVTGEDANQKLLAENEPDLVVNAIFGMAGLEPTLFALERGIDVALANKEALIAGGPLVLEAARESGGEIIPVDSEHNSFHQLLRGVEREKVAELVLTCSGGPFRGKTREEIADKSVQEALDHPNWDMGGRITINSATLFNKALELVETCYLFDADPEDVPVVVHPQSVVHAALRMNDGALLAHMGAPDMRHPIQDALLYPERGERDFAPLDLPELDKLTFEEPDHETFPAIRRMREAWELGWHGPLILNAVNELALEDFLNEEISFGELLDSSGTALELAGDIIDPPPASLEAVERLREHSSDCWSTQS